MTAANAGSAVLEGSALSSGCAMTWWVTTQISQVSLGKTRMSV
jgi:hypothetical protein